MKMKKLIMACALSAFAAISATGCASGEGSSDQADSAGAVSSSESAAPSEAAGAKTVRFLTPGTGSDGSAMMSENAQIAQLNGYFEEELEKVGYGVEYYGFQNQGVGVNEALASGEGDIAVYGEYPALTYLSGGNDGVIVGMASSRKQLGILAQDGIKNVADLKGKVVAAALGTNSQQYLEMELKKNGLTMDDVEVINATAEMPSLFTSGDADAIVNDAQMMYYVQDAAGSGEMIAINGDDPDTATNFLVVARKEFLDENPDVLEPVMNALKRAKEFATEDPDKVCQLLADASGMSKEIFDKYYGFDDTFEFWDPELKEENIKSIQKTADYMKENGLIQESINIEDYVWK